MTRKRGLASEAARIVRQRGHNDAREFALAIGLRDDYKNDPTAKKDVIDHSGEPHSVKSGEKKWQIFLYRKTRFQTDSGFNVMNGIGDLLVECIDAFPETFEAYQLDKSAAKQRLRIPMAALAQKLRDPRRRRAFLEKAIFNGTEVKYLTIKHGGDFHVFLAKDVLEQMTERLEVCNSSARRAGHVAEQKVLFRYQGKNLGELEMRNDSETHYREIRFNMIKPKVMAFLHEAIPQSVAFNSLVRVYGHAQRTFGKWANRG